MTLSREFVLAERDAVLARAKAIVSRRRETTPIIIVVARNNPLDGTPLTDDEDRLIPIFMDPRAITREEAKESLVTDARAMAVATDAYAAIFCGFMWTVTRFKPGGESWTKEEADQIVASEPRPRESPDRKHSIVCTVEWADDRRPDVVVSFVEFDQGFVDFDDKDMSNAANADYTGVLSSILSRQPVSDELMRVSREIAGDVLERLSERVAGIMKRRGLADA